MSTTAAMQDYTRKLKKEETADGFLQAKVLKLGETLKAQYQTDEVLPLPQKYRVDASYPIPGLPDDEKTRIIQISVDFRMKASTSTDDGTLITVVPIVSVDTYILRPSTDVRWLDEKSEKLTTPIHQEICDVVDAIMQ